MSNVEQGEDFLEGFPINDSHDLQALSNHEIPLVRNVIMGQVERTGFATFSGMNSPEDLASLAEQLGNPIIHRDSTHRGIITLKPRKGENRPDYSGFTYDAQCLHTDGSTVSKPASLLLFYCETPAIKGGESLLLDGKILYRHLQEQDPELLAALEQPEAGIFGKEQYSAPVFMRSSNGIVSVRFRNDTLVTYSPAIQKKLTAMMTMMDTLAVKKTLKGGEGYILNNCRMLHGRTALKGSRVVHRIQIYANSSFNLTPGFEV